MLTPDACSPDPAQASGAKGQGVWGGPHATVLADKFVSGVPTPSTQTVLTSTVCVRIISTLADRAAAQPEAAPHL